MNARSRHFDRPKRGTHSAVIGLQWGDEGKGKVVDTLAASHDAVVRFNGGANAGHSVVVKGERFSLHLIPSGILYPGVTAVIANGVVIDFETLGREIDNLKARGVDTSSLVISSRAHVVTPWHKEEDGRREAALASDASMKTGIGTTKRGIGPCYAAKAHRAGAIRAGDILKPDLLRERIAQAAALAPAPISAEEQAGALRTLLSHGERFGAHIRDTAYLLHDIDEQGKSILFEGGNATLLDVDHGTYPYVTSSAASALGIAQGSGFPPRGISRVIGVLKAYSTRVGSGPMPTEITDATAHAIRERGREYGTTTGRPRRIGWLDLVAARYACMLNDVDAIALTLLDVLAVADEIRVCTAYRYKGSLTDRFLPDADDLSRVEPVYKTLPGFPDDISGARDLDDLPPAALGYVRAIEDFLGVPIDYIGVGPGREQIIKAGATNTA